MIVFRVKTFRSLLKWIGLSSLVGLFSGVSASLFLILIELATNWRMQNPQTVWGLPIAGFAIAWVYFHYGQDIASGNNLILDEIHNPKKVIPWKMAPIILLGTLFTHLFGGSAGREGTAVQMGASLSDQLSRWFQVNSEDRRILLMAGMSSGFGAAIGAPFAGIVFGMEVLNVGRFKLSAWLECTIATGIAYGTTLILGAPHSQFPKIEIPPFDLRTLFFVGVAGVVFGGGAWIFTKFTHVVERVSAAWVAHPPLRTGLVGLLIVLLYWWEGSGRFAGLGISTIQEALQHVVSWRDPLGKGFFTALTVGSGFKGGEFVPLVFIGTTLGSALSILLPVSFQLLAAVGFAAVFGAAANTPVACSLMAIEIFGWPLAPYAVVACFISYYFSGHQGIYRSQVLSPKKRF